MEKFELAENLFVYPTPGGAFHAISTMRDDPARRFVRALFQNDTTPKLSLEGVQNWSGVADRSKAMNLLHHVQQLTWVQGVERPLKCPNLPLEEILPDLLGKLTENGKVLLAESQGFYLAANGFPHEVAEELSALSAELAILNEKRSGLLTNNLGLSSGAWAITDAAGCSKIGFWPLYIAKQRFVLVLSGLPRFNRPEFVELIWTLSMRYALSTLN
ncbi:MAG: hypothetical protein ACU843_03450 [Gammaproteobacteria bacterium]